MQYEPGFDRCYKCHRVTAGVWQGRGKQQLFTCLRCFGVWIRKLVRLLANYEEPLETPKAKKRGK
jgi:hypothetical protein